MRAFGLIRAAACYFVWCYMLPGRKDDGGLFDRSGSSGFGNGVCQAPD